jgi:hypothetical protein
LKKEEKRDLSSNFQLGHRLHLLNKLLGHHTSELSRKRFFHRSFGMVQSKNIRAISAIDFFRDGFFHGPQAKGSIVIKRGDFIGSACWSLAFIIDR